MGSAGVPLNTMLLFSRHATNNLLLRDLLNWGRFAVDEHKKTIAASEHRKQKQLWGGGR